MIVVLLATGIQGSAILTFCNKLPASTSFQLPPASSISMGKTSRRALMDDDSVQSRPSPMKRKRVTKKPAAHEAHDVSSDEGGSDHSGEEQQVKEEQVVKEEAQSPFRAWTFRSRPFSGTRNPV